MQISLQLILPKQYGDTYLAVPIPEELKRSELVKIIGAREIKECNGFSGNGKSEELHNHSKYNVLTDNIDNTLRSIKDYKNRNQNNHKTYIQLI